jgi:hypothetical protein
LGQTVGLGAFVAKIQLQDFFVPKVLERLPSEFRRFSVETKHHKRNKHEFLGQTGWYWVRSL